MNERAQRPTAVIDFEEDCGPRGRFRFENPVEIIAAEAPEEVRPALRRVERAAAEGLYAAGFVSYEAAPAFDRALRVRPKSEIPLLWFALFDAPAALEDAIPEDLPRGEHDFQLSTWEPSVNRGAYGQSVAAVREAVARGDTYQVNYTFKLRARFRGDDFAFYERLRAAQRTRYGAYLNAGRFRVLSASPELFFRREGRRIVTRPMKGTAARGRWAEEDEGIAARLSSSEKERAENLMIVDLLRNDVGRVAEVGSVRVPELFRVERYPTVFQLTSTVEGLLREGTTLEDLFAALFPCGSVTGAPKVSTTKLIAALEDSPRGVYCGAVGIVAPGGRAAFNVAIRTVVVDALKGEAEYGVGGGITWDSTAEGEYAEAFDKARLLTEGAGDFKLLETLRLEGGDYSLLEEHLARLTESAAYFDFDVSLRRVRAALAAHADSHPSSARRVRLLVSTDGGVRVESEALEKSAACAQSPACTQSAEGAQNPASTLTVALARTPVSRADRFLCHKTTRRSIYEERRAERPGAFDVLLWNEEGELTEFTNGNLVVELDGRRWTPPRECGLLAGTFRAELLRRGEVAERVLRREELACASRCWLVNSVRGWVEVALAGVGTAAAR